jgi:hypothetical protein
VRGPAGFAGAVEAAAFEVAITFPPGRHGRLLGILRRPDAEPLIRQIFHGLVR